MRSEARGRGADQPYIAMKGSGRFPIANAARELGAFRRDEFCEMNTGPLPTNSSQPASSGKRGVLLVEDHPITRNGLAALINREHNLVVCAEADNAATALDLALKHKPHIALVDITLATTTGIELMKQLKAAIPDMPVLAMSMHDESLFAERALRAGARGYVMKNEPSTTIIAAIRQVLTGEVYLSERMREKMLRGLAVSGKQDIVFPIDKLSDREMEVFQLIGEGYGTRQIAEKLGLSVKTIDSYREHLKVKLQLSSGADLVRHAIQWAKSESVA